jgi:hypothetical protein
MIDLCILFMDRMVCWEIYYYIIIIIIIIIIYLLQTFPSKLQAWIMSTL